MVRYLLTERVRKSLQERAKNLGYELKCRKCGFELKTGDCVESKPSKYKKRKFYHCECYDGSFMEECSKCGRLFSIRDFKNEIIRKKCSHCGNLIKNMVDDSEKSQPE